MSPMLEDELRATLAVHAGDVSPDAHLAEAAMSRAVRLRRTKRLQIAAGAAAVVGVVALVPLLAALGPADHSAPPIQPGPSVSPGPVPEIVLEQAAQTHALLGTPTTIVDGVGPDVLTVPVANEYSLAGGVNQLVLVARATGGYVIKLQPGLPGDMKPEDADPVSALFVRPDGSTTLLGHPTSETAPVVSQDGSLVAFETAPGGGDEHALVVTDLTGRVLHEHVMTGPQDVRYVTADGLWYSCIRLTCRDPQDNQPHYWGFAGDTLTMPPLPPTTAWGAQNGDELVVGDYGQEPALEAYDVSAPDAPRRLWRAPLSIRWAAFDFSGSHVLVLDDVSGKVLSLDAATGEVLDSASVAPEVGFPMLSPDNGWLVYSYPGDTTDVIVTAVRTAPDGTVSATELGTYPPFEFPDFRRPASPLVGIELRQHR